MTSVFWQGFVSPGPSGSNTVESATPADHDVALAAHVEPDGHPVATFLAISRPTNPSPRAVVALMVVNQLLTSLIHHVSDYPLGHDAVAKVALHHNVGSLEQSVGIPLLALARLPGGCT